MNQGLSLILNIKERQMIEKKTVVYDGQETMAVLASDVPVIPQVERYVVSGAQDAVLELVTDEQGNPVDAILDGPVGTIKRVIRKNGFLDDEENRCYESAAVVEVPVVVQGLRVSDLLKRLMEMAGNAIDIDAAIPESINLADTARVVLGEGGKGRSSIPQQFKNVATTLRKLLREAGRTEDAKLYTASYVMDLVGSNSKIAAMVAEEKARLESASGLADLGL
jgi:hypothetical protein